MKKSTGPLARRYGTALYESALEISQKSGPSAFEKFTEQARMISDLFDKNIIASFKAPNLPISEKIGLLEELIELSFSTAKQEISSELMSFLKLLVENDRMSEINPVLNFFLKKSDEFLGLSRVSIFSASKMTPSDMSSFESTLSKAMNKKIICKYEEDPSLLAGFVIKVGNVNIDASLKSRLSSLKESLA